jgi:hypothetical protein
MEFHEMMENTPSSQEIISTIGAAIFFKHFFLPYFYQPVQIKNYAFSQVDEALGLPCQGRK